MNGNKQRIITVAAIAALLAAGYYSWIFISGRINNGIITASGNIEAIEVQISSKVGGRVLERRVDEGDTVKKGDVIAKVHVPEIWMQYKALKAQASAASARAKNSRADFKRIKALYRDAMASRSQFDAAKALADSNDQLAKQARALAGVARIQTDDSVIRAPSDGTVLTKAVEPGELASPGSAIVTIADLKALEIKLYVSEREYGKVTLGDRVEMTVDSFPGEKFYGIVKYISDKAEFTPKNIQTKDERVNQMFEVKVSVPNPELKLKPGMPADATIKINDK